MAEGSPDYTHLRVIQGKDIHNKLQIVALDPSGRIIMLPYGYDGSEYRILTVDDEGHLQILVVGTSYFKWGLCGWWRFILSEGSTILDHSDKGNNGLAYSDITLQATYVTGKVEQAIKFDGIDDYVTIPHDPTLAPLVQGAIEFWVNPEHQAVGKYIIDKGLNVNGLYGFIFQPDDTLDFLFYANGRKGIAHIPLSIDTWTHIIVTWNIADNKIVMYFNGEEVGTTSLEGDTPSDVGEPLNFGSRSDIVVGYFKGLLDEIRLYSQSLTPTQVLWRYNNYIIPYKTRTHPVAIDEVGRMEVNIFDLPYKRQILDQYDRTASGIESFILYSDPVPHGAMWILTQIMCYGVDCAPDSIFVHIWSNGTLYRLEMMDNPGIGTVVKVRNQVTLKSGDKIATTFNAVPDGGRVIIDINGYALDAP